jgi:signal transduction histidine kinase
VKRPRWLKRPSRFRSRVFWSVIPIFVVLLATVGVITVLQHRTLVENEFRKRGQEMAASLALSTELGVLAEDKGLLEASLRGTAGASDVAYVVVYAADGRVLALGGNDADTMPTKADALSAAQIRQLGSEPTVQMVSIAKHGSFMEFLAPVVSGKATSPDELLLGVGGSGGATIGFVRLGLSLESVRRHAVSIIQTWVGISLAFLALAVGVIFAFSERITQPIKRLTDHAKQIEAGNLAAVIPVRSQDEIGQLGASFNAMARSLSRNVSDKERLLDELKNLNQTLEDRIRERTAELAERGEELRRSLEEVESMARVSRALGSTINLEEVLKMVCLYGTEISESDACGIVEIDAGSKSLRLVAAHRLPPTAADGLRGLQGDVLEKLREGAPAVGEVAQIEDLAEPSAFPLRMLVLGEGFRSLLSMTLGDGRVLRTLFALRREPGRWSDTLVHLLTTLGSQSQVAIENARLFHEVETQRIELEDKSHAVEAANRHKSEFLANMSHELRTPLNAVIGFSEVLLERMFGELNEKQEDYLRDILGSGRHLLSLINDILDLSKIEAGRMELELREFDLPAAAHNAMTLVRERAQRRGVRLLDEISADVTNVVGDERKLKQVILNLLSNAVKFTGQGGSVTLRVARDGEAVRVSVVDTGVGIAKEDHEKIFEAFRQARGTSHAGKTEGTGLGLTLSRKIVDLHGGRLWVESKPQQGSTFSFTLPKLTVPPDGPHEVEGVQS